MKKGLIMMGHGSKAQAANDEFETFLNDVAASQKLGYQAYGHAYLSLSPPTLMQAVDNLQAQQVDHIDIYPVFFNQGIHVGKDIPLQISECMDKYPQCEFALLDYFGSNQALSSFMVEHLQSLNQAQS